jgi:hypothetical protein
MNLNPEMLARCHKAIPALGKCHASLLDRTTEITNEEAKEAADALWHWPELVHAAIQLYEFYKPRYHSLQVTADAMKPTCACGHPSVSGVTHRTEAPCTLENDQ